jgi:hypothetical protein
VSSELPQAGVIPLQKPDRILGLLNKIAIGTADVDVESRESVETLAYRVSELSLAVKNDGTKTGSFDQ